MMALMMNFKPSIVLYKLLIVLIVTGYPLLVGGENGSRELFLV